MTSSVLRPGLPWRGPYLRRLPVDLLSDQRDTWIMSRRATWWVDSGVWSHATVIGLSPRPAWSQP
ncbi:MAG: hypothetical protein AB7W28_01755 [Armatimonadota bacterium]